MDKDNDGLISADEVKDFFVNILMCDKDHIDIIVD